MGLQRTMARAVAVVVGIFLVGANGFNLARSDLTRRTALHAQRKKDNKAMAFLRKIGRVGGQANQDFKSVIGIDEGSAGKHSGGARLRKASGAYKSCTETGVVDDMTEDFPFSSSGTRWSAFSDRVMGGLSSGSVAREVCAGRIANVLRGSVTLANNGGFIQMATDLVIPQSKDETVDASDYKGIELDVRSEGPKETETFNIHLKNKHCLRPFSSYRAKFEVDRGDWKTIRLPWDDFKGKGPGAEDVVFDTSCLRRVGVVAIGREMKVHLALAGLRFYS
mmetsp:Transcript_2554/g.4375  ORF Transcript_2554/g.4375 Transcript_2554/m.4375 type:complete len:279 (-) Transcript_2554:1488-2324(-)